MLHTQEGGFINGNLIEEWKVVEQKKDSWSVVAIGASEHPFHYAPKERCESVLGQIVTQVENGFQHTLDFRGVDAEHFEAAKPKPRGRSRTTTKAKTETPADVEVDES